MDDALKNSTYPGGPMDPKKTALSGPIGNSAPENLAGGPSGNPARDSALSLPLAEHCPPNHDCRCRVCGARRRWVGTEGARHPYTGWEGCHWWEPCRAHESVAELLEAARAIVAIEDEVSAEMGFRINAPCIDRLRAAIARCEGTDAASDQGVSP